VTPSPVWRAGTDLRSIQLQRLTDGFDETQWGELTTLSSLEMLGFGLDDGATLHTPAGLQLPRVRTLNIINGARRPAPHFSHLLAAALPAFPGVQKLQLFGLIDIPVDLAPLALLPQLQEVQLSSLRPMPATPLPPHLKVTHYPRPRT
jgi:hypothetical protein